MPYLKCNKCHHEWEGSKSSKCDWCGAGGRILEEKTPLEKMVEDFYEVERSRVSRCIEKVNI